MSAMAKLGRHYCKARLLARRLARDAGGLALVEFALIVPVMITILLGTVEVSDVMTLSIRTINISGSVANVVARCSNVSTGDLNDIMRISDALLGRYARGPLYIEIVSVKADAAGAVTVDWSYDHNHRQPLAPGAVYTGPDASLVPANGTRVIATVTYRYRSPVAQYIHGAVSLQHTYIDTWRGTAAPLGATSCTY